MSDPFDVRGSNNKLGWALVRIKRRWVPEWLFTIYAKILPPWVWPFRQIFTAKVSHDPR